MLEIIFYQYSNRKGIYIINNDLLGGFYIWDMI